MRDTNSWKQALIKEIKAQWPTDATLFPSEFCNVELGLYLLSCVASGEPADSLWMLLTGVPLELPAAHQRMVGNARHILIAFKSRYQWNRALEQYRQITDWLRGYDIEPDSKRFTQRPVTLAAKRFEIYADALEHLLP